MLSWIRYSLLTSFLFAGVIQSLPVQAQDTLMFHGNRQRHGWNNAETILTPAVVRNGGFGRLWDSPRFNSVTIGGVTYAPHLYATPLYADKVFISTGSLTGTFNVVFAATNNGDVYAVNAIANGTVAAGTILWHTNLGKPVVVPISSLLEGPIPMGVLSTPVIDRTNYSPGRLYVTSVVDNGTGGEWRVFALNLSNGTTAPGWLTAGVAINNSALNINNINKNGGNGKATFEAATLMSQRGALNISSLGSKLYIPFGGYNDTAAGWLVVIDTTKAKILSAFSGGQSSQVVNGGMWGAGGVSIDNDKNVYVTTGNSNHPNYDTTPNTWGESLLKFDSLLTSLKGSYTPANYIALEIGDIDIAASSPVAIDLDPATTDAPKLVVFGGKQGTMYLVNRASLPGSLTNRSATRSPEKSLLASPIAHPLNIFGPDSDLRGNSEYAKMRSTPAYFNNGRTNYLYISGVSKTTDGDGGATINSVPPSIVRLRISPSGGYNNGVVGRWPYLINDLSNNNLLFLSPGAPVVTSNKSNNPLVWVLAANVRRSSSLLSPTTPHPILYAIDGNDLTLLWNSSNAWNFWSDSTTWHQNQAQLQVGGKYSTPTIAHGTVFVGTDRIQAFGLPAITPKVLTPTADTYVRDGIYASTNFGTASTLEVKTASAVGSNRNAYFAFSLNGISSISRATLRICVDTSDGTSVPLDVFAVSAPWSESTMTWNNQVGLGTSPLNPTPISLNGTQYIWYEFDVTSYVQAQKSGSATAISFVLHSKNNGGTNINVKSREASVNQPQLVINP
ncbi:CBM96 family carbohydrate-binding protein [Nostoc sp.]|uniref:CBM96 family carbohydrate-binding protein n=1 Tax=Nostoc sp. TaxID=1180 RepID=UPI002FF820DF